MRTPWKVQFVKSGEKIKRGRIRRRYYGNIKTNHWDKNVHLMAVDQECSNQVTFWTEILSSAQCREIIDQLKACHLVKKDAAVRSSFCSLCDFYCYNGRFTLVSLLRTHTDFSAGMWEDTLLYYLYVTHIRGTWSSNFICGVSEIVGHILYRVLWNKTNMSYGALFSLYDQFKYQNMKIVALCLTLQGGNFEHLLRKVCLRTVWIAKWQ